MATTTHTASDPTGACCNCGNYSDTHNHGQCCAADCECVEMATTNYRKEAMNEETYQGRTNAETWDIAAVSDNDRPLYNAVTRIVAANLENQRDLADALKDFFERKVEGSDESAHLLRAQLVSTALGRVNWRELAAEFTYEVQNEGRVDVGEVV